MMTAVGNIGSEPAGEDLPDAAYGSFKREFELLSGIRLDLYKEKQMKRRINTLIARKGLQSYDAFLAKLRSDPAELAAFNDYITINVTEFFRTPEHWERFETEVIRNLAERGGEPLKIWSCACSTGEEPFSIAISLLKRQEVPDFDIIATDINEKVIRLANEGVYTEKITENLPEEILERFFVQAGSGKQIADTVRRHVKFSKLDMLRDRYPQECDLVVCRNVLIYFTEEAKNEIYEKTAECLKPGGYLFTGNTEQIIYYKKYGFKKISNYLYRKVQRHDSNFL